MMRKVIQIAESTQLISLPRKWCISNNIKKGDELDVETSGRKLTVSTDSSPQNEQVEVDISKLDRTSIVYLIRALYKKGYDEIKVNFGKLTVPHYRIDKDVNVASVVHFEMNRCPGLEIIELKPSYCVLKVISKADPKEFDNILRRTFLMVGDTCKDLMAALKTNDKNLLGTIEEKHDNATRFINHCCRMINKRLEDDPKKATFLFNIISILDKVLDNLKNVSRAMLKYDDKITDGTIAILEKICESYDMYYDLFYKFNLENIHKMNQSKEQIYREILVNSKEIPKQELFLLSEMHQSLELFRALIEARMSLEF